MHEPATSTTSPAARGALESRAVMHARLAWFAPAILLLAVALAYANGLRGPFVFDDIPSIVIDPELARVWPGAERFLERSRTITTLSFALNRARSGLDPLGYHLVNVVVHALAGLTLFGVVRRTLALPRFARRSERDGPTLALIVAALWLLHPLQTESVTYVVQRAESLMGLFYLLTLYATIRAATSARDAGWQALAVLACALGMGSKPVMVTAPLVILAYDRVFLAPSWRALLRRRAGLYLGLCLGWVVLAASGILATLATPGESARSSVGFDMPDVTPVRYLLTQPGVLLHYLRLSLWPHPLVIDYGWPMVASARAAVPALAVVAVLLGASLVALARGAALGFVGAWFFAILAPTSSVVPLRDAAFEHRMYLALAGPATLVVLAAHALVLRLSPRGVLLHGGRALGLTLAGCAALALGLRTFARNRDYQDDVALWRSTIRYAPGSARAYNLLAGALVERGRHEEAIAVLREGLAATRFDAPTSEQRVTHALTTNLASTLLIAGRAEEALEVQRAALREDPDDVVLLRQLGVLAARVQRWNESLETFRKALEVDPRDARSHLELGRMQRARGDPASALRELREARELAAHDVEPALELGRLLAEEFGDWNAAEQAYRSALELRPDDAGILTHLGLALEQQGELQAAIDAYSGAARMQPESERAQYALGRCYEAQGQLERAVRQYELVLRLAPEHAWAAEALRRIREREDGS